MKTLLIQGNQGIEIRSDRASVSDLERYAVIAAQAVLTPRLVKKPKTMDEINADAEERCKQQRVLIDAYKAAHPQTGTNTMFEELTQQHPDVFNDPDFIEPEGDI